MSRKRLLLIDDDPDIREVASMTLEVMNDFDVVTAECGRDGVAAAHAVAPDVILLDVMMPGDDGPSTLALLRQSTVTQKIPVIFLTAKIRPTDRERLTALDVAGVISKPFDPASLGAEILLMLESHTATKELRT